MWPDTYVVESSLTRNISVLRKVLDDENGSRFIESISKRGCRFVAPTSMEPAASSETLVSNLSELRTLSRHWIRAAAIIACLVVAAS
jgi:DNA-binding winged helix-turn-helix (wHTH) protein